jgi:diguanylate cyclase (GGDEF)-like protein
MNATPAPSEVFSPRQLLADWIFPEGRERREELAREQDIDHLTGLANRRALDRALATAEADSRTAVILFDANNFGLVNKRLGHATGDELLRELAAALQIVARAYGVASRVFRLGGDEFVVLAPAGWAEKLRDAAERHFGQRRFLSGGLAFTVSLSGTVAQTLVAADDALQMRKQATKESNEVPQ